MTSTSAAAPPPVTRRARLQLLARRVRLGQLAAVALVALLVGGLVGRATAPGGELDAQRAVETTVLPIALDADGIWTSSTESRPAISDALVTLRRDGDPTLVRANLEAWLTAYDQALVRLAAGDVPPAGRPVQRQLIAAVTLSRDAVEVLGHAAEVEDELHRRDLTTEVGRLRDRAEQLTASARASSADLAGTRTDVAPLPALRGFLEGRG